MNEKEAKHNYLYLEETRDLKESAEQSFLELGRRLNNIRTEKKYAPNYETFKDFLRDIDVPPSKASTLSNIYKKFIQEYGFNPIDIAQIGWSKMSEILQVCDSKETAQEWIDKAKVLKKTDLRKEVWEARGKVANDDPKRLVKIADLVRWKDEVRVFAERESGINEKPRLKELWREIKKYLDEQEE